jgi:uncharacterized membrane-anchored protein YhcB (DUF1043 family)
VRDRLGSAQARLDSAQARLDSVQARLDGVQARLDSVQAHLDSVQAHLDSVQAHLDSLQAHLDSVQARLLHFVKCASMSARSVHHYDMVARASCQIVLHSVSGPLNRQSGLLCGSKADVQIPRFARDDLWSALYDREDEAVVTFTADRLHRCR